MKSRLYWTTLALCKTLLFDIHKNQEKYVEGRVFYVFLLAFSSNMHAYFLPALDIRNV